MRLYLSGPMRGRPEFNFPAFDAATAMLRGLGHRVFSPAEADRTEGFDPAGMEGTGEELEAAGFDIPEAMARDIYHIVTEVDGVGLLPNWHLSKGCLLEAAVATSCGLRLYEVRPDGQLVEVHLSWRIMPELVTVEAA